ncbi:MAG: hypothetical protein HZC51_07395 [Nitrospirae bacterium]|nr:hypothetical protein [Nitrospirota bacterium]
MPSCIEWGEERHQECTLTRDEGYRSCSSWGWFSWLCIAWTWVSNVVCVVWTWVTTSFCVVWDIITTIINAILVTLESILGWLLSAIAFIFELLECIPVLGTFIRWIYNGLSFIAMTIASLPDALLGAAGVRPEKILRVCTVILRDEHGIPIASVDYAKTILQLAVDVYKRDAKIVC